MYPHSPTFRSQTPQATLFTQRKMQQKESLHSPQKTMTCLRCALRANRPWVSVLASVRWSIHLRSLSLEPHMPADLRSNHSRVCSPVSPSQPYVSITNTKGDGLPNLGGIKTYRLPSEAASMQRQISQQKIDEHTRDKLCRFHASVCNILLGLTC